MTWLALAGSFFLGSIPTSYFIARAKKGIDIRQVGSGNVGATNVMRSVGKGAGLFVLAMDIAKGWLAVQGLGALAPDGAARLWCGGAAVAGHIWTPWLKFHGGKGVATSAGVILAWSPALFGNVALTFAVVFALTRIVSISSMSCAVALPLAAVMTRAPRAETLFGLILAILIISTHRSNIARLVRGEEKKLF